MLFFNTNFTKLASRKKLKKYIKLHLEQIKEKDGDLNVINIGAGGEIKGIIKKYTTKIYEIDIDPSTKPNLIIDIGDKNVLHKIDFKPNVICMFEVLEHTNDPVQVIDNLYNILPKDSYLLMSTPFVFHEHEIPFDHYRFTEYGLKMLLKKFSISKIFRRNGWLETIFVLLIRMKYEKFITCKIIGNLFLVLYILLYPLITLIQILVPYTKQTTGFFIFAKK